MLAVVQATSEVGGSLCIARRPHVGPWPIRAAGLPRPARTTAAAPQSYPVSVPDPRFSHAFHIRYRNILRFPPADGVWLVLTEVRVPLPIPILSDAGLCATLRLPRLQMRNIKKNDKDKKQTAKNMQTT